MEENWTVTMSKDELKRSAILKMADEKLITQKAGAERIGVTERQFRRLIRQHRSGGGDHIGAL